MSCALSRIESTAQGRNQRTAQTRFFSKVKTTPHKRRGLFRWQALFGDGVTACFNGSGYWKPSVTQVWAYQNARNARLRTGKALLNDSHLHSTKQVRRAASRISSVVRGRNQGTAQTGFFPQVRACAAATERVFRWQALSGIGMQACLKTLDFENQTLYGFGLHGRMGCPRREQGRRSATQACIQRSRCGVVFYIRGSLRFPSSARKTTVPSSRAAAAPSCLKKRVCQAADQSGNCPQPGPAAQAEAPTFVIFV